ncbi:MAG: hypothetical protein ACFE95_00050 [Candidatus Hodarchaeota archaeon]
MVKIHNMTIQDVEAVARMVALDHNEDPEKGYREAKEHTLDHLKIVPQHCYVVENEKEGIIAAMVLHPQKEIFEIEDFHIKGILQNKEAFELLKAKLLEYLETIQTEVICCPFALRRLLMTY